MRSAIVVLALVAASCSGAPAIPHSISQTDDAWCTTCHVTGEGGAPISPHPERRNCVGCHSASGTEDVGAFVPWAPSEVVLAEPAFASR